jgi:hypothetical protein
MRRFFGVRALALGLTLAASSGISERAQAQSKLSHAIELFDRGEDARARRELQKLAGKKLSTADAARVHIYLGLLRLNALDTDGTRAEFAKAVSIDPTIELPVDASPKAALVFKQARADADRSAAPQSPAAPAPEPVPAAAPAPAPEQIPTPVVVVDQSSAPATSSSHLASLVVGGVGLASAIAGGVCLGLSASTLSSARSATDVGVSQSDVKSSANQQYLGEWFLGAGGGVVGAAVVVFIIESVVGGKPSAEVASHAVSAAIEGIRF